MKRMSFCIVSLCCLLSALPLAAEENVNLTYGLQNGRFWNLMDADSRPIYLLGIVHGWTLRGHTEDGSEVDVILALTSGKVSLTFEELAEMITSDYANPENRTLPIGWVMMAEMAVHRGDTTRPVVLSALRKWLVDISGKTLRGSQISPINTIVAASKKP